MTWTYSHSGTIITEFLAYTTWSAAWATCSTWLLGRKESIVTCHSCAMSAGLRNKLCTGTYGPSPSPIQLLSISLCNPSISTKCTMCTMHKLPDVCGSTMKRGIISQFRSPRIYYAVLFSMVSRRSCPTSPPLEPDLKSVNFWLFSWLLCTCQPPMLAS